jgi:signal transduction histidine kinase
VRGSEAAGWQATLSGRLRRRLLIAAVLVPIVAGLLRWAGQRVSLYSSEVGVAIMVAFSMAGFVVATVWATSMVERGQRRAEAERRRYRTLVDNLPNGLVGRFDRDLRLSLVGGTGLPHAGLTPDRVEGRLIEEVVPAEIFRELRPRLNATFGGTSDRFELPLGGRLYEVRVHPVHEADGSVDHGLCLVEDVTRARQAEDERRLLETRLADKQRLESLGALAGGVAHDFNNLLVPVLGGTELALARIPPDSPARRPLELVQDGATRAADLTRQLLAYSGKGGFTTGPIDLSVLIGSMRDLLEALAPQAALSFDLAGDTVVDADASQLQQVLLNLVVNAAEAGDGGTIVVSTRRITADRALLESFTLGEDVREGPHAALAVRDSGAGMTDDVRAGIFEPFFTTKASGRGLGLAAVLGIVRGHAGAVRVESAPGAGTTVTVLLPLSAAPLPPPSAPGGADPGRTAVILVVDDEEPVRRIVADLLADSGHEVLVAASGAEAAAILARREDVALALVDLTMPGVPGEQVAAELRRLAPGLPLVFMSGYSAETAADAMARLDAGFLEKPFDRAALLDAVAAALRKPGD